VVQKIFNRAADSANTPNRGLATWVRTILNYWVGGTSHNFVLPRDLIRSGNREPREGVIDQVVTPLPSLLL